jgi:hypothetical protein
MEPEIIQAALHRDKLVLVGSSSFELCLTTNLFHRYPDANEGDLRILRGCAKSHGVEVYTFCLKLAFTNSFSIRMRHRLVASSL